MYDSVELSKAIAASLDDTEAALLACKGNVFPPSAFAAVEADRDFKLCFGNNAPQVDLTGSTITSPSHTCPYKWEKRGRWKHESEMVSPLGGSAFVLVLANPKTPDFRFERRPWNSELGRRARRSGDAALALGQSSFDNLNFTI